MKAVVLEIKGGVAAVLKEDGTVGTTRQICAVGDTIELKDTPAWRFEKLSYGKLRYAAAAVAAALFLTTMGGTYMTVSACSYVSVDVNPSLEFALNRFNRVVQVTAVNEDANRLVEDLNEETVRNDTLSEALTKTISLLEGYGYLDGEADYMLLNIASDDAARSDRLQTEAEAALSEVTYFVTASDRESRRQAQALGISTGRYEEIRSIEELSVSGAEQAVDEDIVKKYQDDSLYELLSKNGRVPERETGSEHPDAAAYPAGGTEQERTDRPEGDASEERQDTERDAREPRQNAGQGAEAGIGQEPGQNAGQGTETGIGQEPGQNPEQRSGQDRNPNPASGQGMNPSQNPNGDAGRDPSQDPSQDPSEDAGQNPGQDPGGDAGQNPGQNPNEDAGQNPGQDPNADAGRDPGQNPDSTVR